MRYYARTTKALGPSVIVVSHICPFPTVHGNCSRIAALLAWLRSRGIHVTYVLQPPDVESERGIRALADAVDALEVVRLPLATSLQEVAARAVKACLSKGQVERLRRVLNRDRGEAGREDIDRWCWPGTRQTVRRLVRRGTPLAVITEYAVLSKCLEEVPASTLKIIDTIEVFFRDRARGQLEDLRVPVVCTPESEARALARADVLVGIQRNDTAALQGLFPHKRVITVGHSYARPGLPPRNPVAGRVLYVGSSNPYNVHGLRQFLARAWPRIRAGMPLAHLRVVGSGPRIAEMEDQHVAHVGRVSDEALRGEYERAHVVINPQTAGTGLKIKCVEALTSGCPLVVNPAGADGLEDGAGAAFLLAADWEDFARHVLDVLTDRDLAGRLEAGALRLAGERFSTAAAYAELALVLERAPA